MTRVPLYSILLAAMAFAVPAQAQHLNAESIDKVLAQAAPLDNPGVARVPAGLPLAAGLFAGRPWWAVMIMCAEHRAGNGTTPGEPRPVLNEALEKGRKFFLLRGAALFAKEQGQPNIEEALLPASGWGTEFALVMEAEAKAGRWSSRETEDACRILGAEQLKAGRAPS